MTGDLMHGRHSTVARNSGRKKLLDHNTTRLQFILINYNETMSYFPVQKKLSWEPSKNDVSQGGGRGWGWADILISDPDVIFGRPLSLHHKLSIGKKIDAVWKNDLLFNGLKSCPRTRFIGNSRVHPRAIWNWLMSTYHSQKICRLNRELFRIPRALPWVTQSYQ